ncbi:MAG: PepSY-associated TM helix domain-containing protein, partial [Bacteroidales bacterium]|nr:PepSY-associated TM helix domain-containing protein [Bacteroidales bacterium]
MKKILLKLHLWIALPFGLIIALICFTGSIMVFEKEINEKVYKERYKVAQASGERITPAEAAAAAAAVLPDTMKIASVQIPFNKESTYAISTPGRRRITVYVDPYTAKVTAIQNPGDGKFFSTVRELHRWLSFRGENRTIGKRITGVTTFAMVVILITGLIAWFPKNRKGLKNRLKISFRHGPRRMLHDLHVAGGFYSMLFLLIMSLTGLTWSFDWYRDATYKLFGAEPPA